MITGTWNGETFTANTPEEVLELIQERIAEWCGERIVEDEEENGGGRTDVTIGVERYTFEMSARLKKS